MNRRDFFIGNAAALALLALQSSGHAKELLKKTMSKKGHWIFLADKRAFIRLDPFNGNAKTIQTPCLAHSFQVYPGEEHIVMGVSKFGTHLSVVDFKNSKIIKSINPKGNRKFYGHTCWAPDGNYFYSTQVDSLTGATFLVLYDKKNLKSVNEYQFSKGGAHDLAFLPDSKTLAITTSGIIFSNYKNKRIGTRVDHSKLIFFDSEKGSVVDEKTLSDQSQFFGHLKIGSNGRVYLISSVFENFKGSHKASAGMVFDTALNDPVTTWEIPTNIRKKLRGELLSIELNESIDRLAVSNPTGGQVMLFSLKDRKFLSAIDNATTGLAWDQESNILYGAHRQETSVKSADQSRVHFRELSGDRINASAHFLIREKVQ